MKKIIISLFIASITLAVYGQTNRTAASKANIAINTKKAVEANVNKTASDAAAEQAKNKEEEARNVNNGLCKFGFDDRGLFSIQNTDNDYVIYEIPGMSASDLKAATLSAISSLFKSPKDVVTNLGDNIIQLERFVTDVFTATTDKGTIYKYDMSYSQIIQFKDGKVRYNIPSIKQIWIKIPMLGTKKIDSNLPLTQQVQENIQRNKVADEFNSMIEAINSKIEKANDW